MARKTQSKNTAFIVVLAVLMIAAIVVGILISKNSGKTTQEVSHENAVQMLDKKLKKITIKTNSPKKANVEISGNTLAEELPDISKYPLSVEGSGRLNLEIFSSTEKSSKGTDGWLNEVAQKFNASGETVDGMSASVSVRPIASGAAIDYIISGKYVPQLYTPSNELWGAMVEAENSTPIKLIAKRIAGNTAGILVSKDTYNKLQASYGNVDCSAVIKATVNNEITMGYTNPYSSSTGLNFLASALLEFDASDMLSATATAQFQKFQQNVPFVAYSTLQMRDAATNGILDAFIMEYQGYHNATELRDYQFIPFGVRHDSPMYTLGNLSPAEEELAKKFTAFCLSAEMQELAKKYGFNYMDDYTAASWGDTISGSSLVSAQKLWKKEKDAGNPVMAVFVADVSGSMGGAPLKNLQTSLINASQYINSTNYVGLVSYSTNVAIELPIAKFDLNQRSYFTGAVQSLSAGGNTATYDAVLVALDLLQKAKETAEAQGETIKPLLFVLSDGETNVGNDLNDIKDIVQGMEVPCYTIGYNSKPELLEGLSAINEAANINADTDDVVYNLKGLFNAQM